MKHLEKHLTTYNIFVYLTIMGLRQYGGMPRLPFIIAIWLFAACFSTLSLIMAARMKRNSMSKRRKYKYILLAALDIIIAILIQVYEI